MFESFYMNTFEAQDSIARLIALDGAVLKVLASEVREGDVKEKSKGLNTMLLSNFSLDKFY